MHVIKFASSGAAAMGHGNRAMESNGVFSGTKVLEDVVSATAEVNKISPR
jgi:hypothetical protein